MTVGAASKYLRGLGKVRLDSGELERFMEHVAGELEKDEQQRALDYLLAVADSGPEQVMYVGKSDPVLRSLGLQLSVRRYAISKEFDAAQREAANESDWKKILLSLGSLSLPGL
jgi:hypothetical protein